MSYRILLIDDEPEITELLAEVLRPTFRVNRCHDPREAIDRIRRGEPDLVITDVRMPGLSGFEILKAADECTPAVPTVLTTGDPDSPEVKTALRGGAAGLLEKPFAEPEEIIGLINRILKETHR